MGGSVVVTVSDGSGVAVVVIAVTEPGNVRDGGCVVFELGGGGIKLTVGNSVVETNEVSVNVMSEVGGRPLDISGKHPAV